MTRERVAALIAALLIAAGVASLFLGRSEAGLQVGRQGELVVVEWVAPGGQAHRDGVLPGMVVTELNGVQLLELPTYYYPDDWDGEEPAPSPEIRPSRPTPISISDAALGSLLAGGVLSFAAIQPWDLEAWDPAAADAGDWNVVGFYYSNDTLRSAAAPFAIGVLILVGGFWWLKTGRAGPTMEPLALPLALATSAGFLVRPVDVALASGATVGGSFLLVFAMIPLAAALVGLIPGEGERRLVGVAVAACAAVAVLAALAELAGPAMIGIGGVGPEPVSGSPVRWLLVAAMTLLPGIAAAGPVGFRRLEGGPAASGRVLQSAEYAVAGATPMFALATEPGPYLFPLSFWLIGVAIAGRFTIRPLARLATRATLQRDLVVAATEAERARVAADIHDDALQELSLLVRRLDSGGDAEGAEIARQVADRLRAICGDLRLPILDDLGVGPALDWLVLRIERLAGGEVRLEKTDGTRPPADVELAFFRVAQEALANAVKHGRPPIVVRYHATPAGASLSIDDAGPGIAPEAGVTAEREGRFGLVNMQQRAEQIGAILDIRRWPGGGTHVALEWRPR